jgi:hypothetical protein
MHAITTAHKHVFQAAKQRSGRVLHKVVSPMFVDALSEVHGKLGQDYYVLLESVIVPRQCNRTRPCILYQLGQLRAGGCKVRGYLLRT